MVGGEVPQHVPFGANSIDSIGAVPWCQCKLRFSSQSVPDGFGHYQMISSLHYTTLWS